MPNCFSRIAGPSARVSTARRKLPAIVSAAVSTAGPAIPVPPSPCPALDAGFWQPVFFPRRKPYSTPSLLLFPAPFAARARFLGAEIEFLDILGLHQPLAIVVRPNQQTCHH